MGELGDIAILNKNITDDVLQINTADTDSVVMTDYSLGIKADLLFQNELYDVISEDIVNESLNKLACGAGEIISFSYHISSKDTQSKGIIEITDAIQEELSKYSCEKILKTVSEIGYNIDKFDINSVCLGKQVRQKSDIVSGDIIVGLTTDRFNIGLYPLLLDKYKNGIISNEEFKDCLKSTYSYYNEIIDLYKKNKIKDAIYINAKNIVEQINSVLPTGLCCDVNLKHIPHQDIIDKLSEIDNINYYKEFGLGLCCCLITDKASNEIFFEDCQKFNPFVFGTIK